MLIPLPYKLAAAAAVLVGIFFFGYFQGTSKARERIAKYETAVTQLQTALDKERQLVREVVRVEYVDRVTKIKEREIVVQEVVKEVVPSQFPLSNGWVHAHNAAASLDIKLDLGLASDPTSSGVMDSVALETVAENYAICLKNAAQLSSLQKFVNETNEAIDKINKERGVK